MKVIDLLNKIANGEEVPKKIKFKNNIYKWIERNDNIFNYKQEYKGRLIDNYLCDDWFMDSKSILTDEVEIIEEEKKIPEKLDLTFEDHFIKEHFKKGAITYLPTFEAIKRLYNKQCEIIDYLKSKGK